MNELLARADALSDEVTAATCSYHVVRGFARDTKEAIASLTSQLSAAREMLREVEDYERPSSGLGAWAVIHEAKESGDELRFYKEALGRLAALLREGV